jgi:tetratricopeptide (TPR) repeat protein
MSVGGRKAVIGLTVGYLIAAVPALAASQQDWDGCQSKDPKVAVPACSTIIRDDSESPQNRADAYAYRAAMYLTQGNVDRAIADYGEALKLTPRNVTVYVSRALAEFRKGQNDQAILDYSIADKIDSGAVARIASGNPDVQRLAEAARASPPPPSALAGVDNLREAVAPPPLPPPAPSPPPPPPAPPPEKQWNAIASSIWRVRGRVHVAIGYSGTRDTEDEARRSAVQACRDAGGTACKSTGAWNYGCVYITTGHTTNRAGWASGDTTEAALKRCRSNGFTCKQPIGGCVE